MITGNVVNNIATVICFFFRSDEERQPLVTVQSIVDQISPSLIVDAQQPKEFPLREVLKDDSKGDIGNSVKMK